MPKIRKVKRKKSFKVNINRKRARNKLRKLPTIQCKDIKEAWDKKKSTRTNLKEMGLAYDANAVLEIPSTKQKMIGERLSEEKMQEESTKPKIHVVENLEAEAKAPRERNFRLPKDQVRFVTYMMGKYGDDYKSMVRDKKNYYQLTWRQMRAKINTFKGIPEQYAEYLLETGEIVLDEPETLLETKRRIGQENLAKYSAPAPKKQKKLPERESVGWVEESLEKESKCEEPDRLEPISESSNHKLQLFSESEEEDSEADEDDDMDGDSDKDGASKFVDLKNMSDEELSDDDISDNNEFVTGTDDEVSS